MGSGNTAEVEALGPMEEPREDAFDWQAAQRKDEAEVDEILKGNAGVLRREQLLDRGLLRSLKAPFSLNRVKPRKGHGGGTLHYIDARDVMYRLDDVLGPLNWQDSYKEVMGRIICTLSIRFDEEWVSKSDGAGDTKIEGDKGAISDAFKRAACRWGIGRYLYYFPKDGSIPSWADPDSGKWTDEVADRI